jgi:hypothetical protein
LRYTIYSYNIKKTKGGSLLEFGLVFTLFAAGNISVAFIKKELFWKVAHTGIGVFCVAMAVFHFIKG